MCGTSVAQIERTYYHLNDEIRLTNALADYRRTGKGQLNLYKENKTKTPHISSKTFIIIAIMITLPGCDNLNAYLHKGSTKGVDYCVNSNIDNSIIKIETVKKLCIQKYQVPIKDFEFDTLDARLTIYPNEFVRIYFYSQPIMETDIIVTRISFSISIYDNNGKIYTMQSIIDAWIEHGTIIDEQKDVYFDFPNDLKLEYCHTKTENKNCIEWKLDEIFGLHIDI